MGQSVVIYASRGEHSVVLFDRDMRGPLNLMPEDMTFDDFFPVGILELPDDAMLVSLGMDSWSGRHGSRIRFSDGTILDALESLHRATRFATRFTTLAAPRQWAPPTCQSCGQSFKDCETLACADCGGAVIGCLVKGAEGPVSIYGLCRRCAPETYYERGTFLRIRAENHGFLVTPAPAEDGKDD